MIEETGAYLLLAMLNDFVVDQNLSIIVSDCFRGYMRSCGDEYYKTAWKEKDTANY